MSIFSAACKQQPELGRLSSCSTCYLQVAESPCSSLGGWRPRSACAVEPKVPVKGLSLTQARHHLPHALLGLELRLTVFCPQHHRRLKGRLSSSFSPRGEEPLRFSVCCPLAVDLGKYSSLYSVLVVASALEYMSPSDLFLFFKSRNQHRVSTAGRCNSL